MGLQVLNKDVYNALVMRTWSDEAFSRFLDEDPKAAIAEMGQQLDDVGALRVIRDTAEVKYLLVPNSARQTSAVGEAGQVGSDGAKESVADAPAMDEVFLAKLESDPRATLAEVGQLVPDNIDLVVVRDSEALRHVHIPLAPPAEDEVSDEELLKVQGGGLISFGVGITIAGWIATITVHGGGTFD